MPALPPKVLLVSFLNFTGIAHLPRALSEADFRVAALSPSWGFLAQTRFLEKQYDLPEFFFAGLIRQRLLAAFDDWQPDLILPGDDVALAFLQNLSGTVPSARFAALRRVLRHSLGKPEQYGCCTDKARFGSLARRLGIRLPEQYHANNPASLLTCSAVLGYPLVFKKTLSFSGIGTEICPDAATLTAHVQGFFGTGTRPFTERLRQEAYQAWGIDLRPLMRPQREQILLQRYVPGPVLSHVFVAWQGQYAAGFSYEKVEAASGETGPAARIQSYDSPEAGAIARRVAAELGFSGFACLDFIRESGTDRLVALECNARPTHAAAQGRAMGVDLCGALAQAMRGEIVVAPTPERRSRRLFPDAWWQAPAAFGTGTDAHVPWDDAALLHAFLRGPARPRTRSRGRIVLAMSRDWVLNRWVEWQQAREQVPTTAGLVRPTERRLPRRGRKAPTPSSEVPALEQA